MYLIPYPVPAYVDGTRTYIASDWKRALELQVLATGEEFGEVVVLCPWVDVAVHKPDQALVEADTIAGVTIVPVVPLRASALRFWLFDALTWRRVVKQYLADAAVVHTFVDNLRRPLSYQGFTLAHRRGIPTVLIVDVDRLPRFVEEQANLGPARRIARRLYSRVYARVMRRAVARATLCLLKGDELVDRYWSVAANPHRYEDAAFTSHEVISAEALDERLARVPGGGSAREFKLAYCGRIIQVKGIDTSVRVIRELADRGVAASLTLIGDGPLVDDLKDLSVRLGIGDRVHFVGPRPYGPELLSELARFDALIYTPVGVDTPRMIFDGYAAGLPLVATETPYVIERQREEGAAVTFGVGDVEQGAHVVQALASDWQAYSDLARRAREGALVWAADRAAVLRGHWVREIAGSRERGRQPRGN